MDIVQLKYFVSVAESGSFSEAAEIMFSAQSTVSKQIASLEKELNVQLFDRSKRKVALTVYGEVFLAHARKIIDNYNSMIKEIASISTQDNSKAIIRATTAMLPYNIISTVASFKKECSWADIHVEEFESEDILKMLKDNECDLAFFRVGKFDEDAYEKLPILTEKFVAILPANHPLAKESCISLAQLSNENFIFCRQNTGLHRNSVSACHTMGFNPNIIATSNHASNIFEMVAMNMGVSLLLKRGAEYAMTDHFADKVSIVPLKETFTIEVALARYKKHNHTKASIAFWDYVKHMVQASQ
ncbi:MAG: LysR family transcriptional regulator [Oscillospiraceae bacterium]|nr:LysR family transcriptional regulator [Oscillospiraceae bacterium]